jgi:tape measure domain-containing protein
MSSTDERIVKMQFDNATFKQRAAETKQSLKDLDQAVETTGKSKGLFSLSNSMQKVSVTASKMAIITTTALATITNKVVQSGIAMANSITFGPITQGFHEYEALLTKQNTIQNATGKSAKVVKGVLNELNRYSDKTIYNFGNMTSSLQKFVNAGVPLKQATVSIEGIANAAAFAGASSEEANRAMYAFSQSMSLGFIQLQDWNQIEAANLGTQKFKQTLLEAGVAAGTLTKKGDQFITKSGKAVTATKGWRDGLHDQWATTEVLNKALGAYADKNTELGKKAFKAAQDVRTFSAFMDTLKESLGSGWAKIFTTLIGGLGEATALWTGMSKAVSGNVTTFFNWLNVTLKTFKALGGFGEIAQGFKNLWAPVAAIFQAVGDAWHEAFPDKGPGSGQVLFNIAHGFAAITSPLQLVADWIPKLVPFLAALFKTVKMGAGGLGELAHLIGNLVKGLGDLFAIKAPSSGGLSSFFEKLLAGIGNVFQAGVNIAKEILDGIVKGFTNGSFDTVATIISGGLLAAITLYIRKGLKGGSLFKFDLAGGLKDSVTGVFRDLTDTLKAMQTQLKVKTLTEIAAAVAILAASMVALSFIDGKKLGKALAAVGAGMVELLAGMALLDKIGGATAFVQLPVMAAGLVLLSTAVLILTAAIAAMSMLSWEQIGKGLAGVGASLVVIAAGMKLMPATLPITGAGLVLVASGLSIMAGALALMGLLSWETIGKGLATTAASLVVIGLAMQTMPLSLPITAAGLVLVAVALNGIAAALKIMGTSSWEEIGKGLATLGGAMAILSIGLNTMSGTLLGSAALLVAAGAIAILTPSLVIFSKMSWKGIAKGLAALAGGLLILGVALTAMSASIVGAAALLIVAPAILALATALAALSALSWEGIGKALVALAAGLAVIGAAGALLSPVIPSLLGLGAALLLIGGGLALAGIGIGAFAAGLAVLVGLGAGAIAYLGKFVGAFFKLLAPLGVAFGQFLVSLAQTIAQNAPAIAGSFIAMLSALIDQATKLLPKLGPLINAAIKLMLGVIKSYIPKLVDAGGDIIVSLIRGLGKQAGRIVDAATDVIIKFAQGLEKNAFKMANAGIALIATFLHDLASAIRSGSAAIGGGLTDVLDAMKDVGVNMVKGIIEGITDMFGDATDAIGNLAEGMVKKAKGILHIFSPSRVFQSIGAFLVKGLTLGIQSNAGSAIQAVASMVGGQIAVANEYISAFIQSLDQQSIAARAKAEGLAAAAEKAAKAADKTKSKADDKSADRIQKQADAASKAADAAEARAEAAKAAQDRKEQFASADSFERAQMRAEDAQNYLDAAKAAEARAAKEVVEANALDRQSKAEGLTEKQRKQLRAEADALRAQAAKDAAAANASLASARTAAADALKYQKLAGDEAAAAFQAAFDADAKAAADEAAFNKLSDSEKAAFRRKQAEELQAKAQADLAKAKELAYTDLEAANALAQQAMDEADLARQYLNEATGLATSGTQGTSTGGVNGTVVDLAPTDAAAIAMNNYADLYDSAVAAAAATQTVEFNQYNTSPESLSPTEIYRNTNNQLTYAVDKLAEVAA